jgi:hypothetical protein
MTGPDLLRYLSLVACAVVCTVGLHRTKNPGFLLMAIAVVGWPLLILPLQRWLSRIAFDGWDSGPQRWGLIHMALTVAYFWLIAWALAVLARSMPSRER